MITRTRLRELFEYNNGALYRIKITGPTTRIGQRLGSLDNTGYIRAKVDGRRYQLHNLIFIYHYGYNPPIVDHIDTNKLNNYIENLRELSHGDNSANTRKIWNKTGYRGVYATKSGKRYRVMIHKDKVRYSLGSFDSLGEATMAYSLKRKELYPHLEPVAFPEEHKEKLN